MVVTVYFGTEGVGSNPTGAAVLANSFCPFTSAWIPDSLNWGRYNQRRERDELHPSHTMLTAQWNSNYHCPDVHIGFGAFAFTFYLVYP